MKKIIYPLILILMFFCFGCGSKESATQSVESATQSADYAVESTDYIETDGIPMPSMQVQIINAITADIQMQDINVDVDGEDAMYIVVLDDTYYLILDVHEGKCYSSLHKQLGDNMEYVCDMAYEIIGENLVYHVQLDLNHSTIDGSDFNFFDVETYCFQVQNDEGYTEYIFAASDVVTDFIDMVSTGSFLFPVVVPRVAEDDIYFTPLGDDYAFFVESQEKEETYFGNNLSVYLLDFDENGNVGRMVLRSPNYNDGVDEDGICTKYYYEEVEFDPYMLDADQIARQYFTTDKEVLRTYSIENFVAGYMSNSEVGSFSFVSNNDVADFQLLDYYTPTTDDYYIQEFFYSTNQSVSTALHAIVLEFDTDGSTLDRVCLAMLPEENKEEIAIAKEQWITLDAENHVYQYPNNTYTYGMYIPNRFKESKQNLANALINSVQRDNYGQSMATDGLAQGFSKPYYNEEQLALYNQSIDTGVWVNALIFENHYDDKITYTILDNMDENAYQKWIIAYEDGKSCSSYNIYQFSGGTARDNANGLSGNVKVYEDRDLVYHQGTYFSYDSKYGLSKEDVEAVMRAETEEYGLSLVSVEEGGVPMYSQTESYIKCNQVAYPTQAQLESFVPEDTTPTGDGIYASGISEFEGDALYFTPLTDDWEVEFDKKYPDRGYLYSYDEDGNTIQKLERHVTEANFTVNSGSIEVFSPEEYQENTYVNVGNAYYFNRQVYSSAYGGFSDKQGRLTYFAENSDQYDHYFSNPEIDMNQSILEMYCDASDFKTLEYVTPATDDYRIEEKNATLSIYYNQTNTNRTFTCVLSTIVSYDTSGIPVDIQKVYLFDTAAIAEQYATRVDPITMEQVYLDEYYENCERNGRAVIMKNETTVNADAQQWFDPANEERTKYKRFVYFYEFDSYQDAVSQDEDAVWFSKPYLTLEQI